MTINFLAVPGWAVNASSTLVHYFDQSAVHVDCPKSICGCIHMGDIYPIPQFVSSYPMIICKNCARFHIPPILIDGYLPDHEARLSGILATHHP